MYLIAVRVGEKICSPVQFSCLLGGVYVNKNAIAFSHTPPSKREGIHFLDLEIFSIKLAFLFCHRCHKLRDPHANKETTKLGWQAAEARAPIGMPALRITVSSAGRSASDA